MSCKHKKYIAIDMAFTTLAQYRNKVVDVKSEICMCRKCGVLFVPEKLREIPQLNTVRDLEE